MNGALSICIEKMDLIVRANKAVLDSQIRLKDKLRSRNTLQEEKYHRIKNGNGKNNGSSSGN